MRETKIATKRGLFSPANNKKTSSFIVILHYVIFFAGIQDRLDNLNESLQWGASPQPVRRDSLDGLGNGTLGLAGGANSQRAP